MSFRASAKMVGLTEALAAVEANAAQGAKRAMDRAGGKMKQDLRDQIAAAGLGDRLAKTWQERTYPTKGASLTPAAYVWSKAPAIVDAFARGATIVATAGRRLLAVPTAAVPRTARGRALTPQQVESRFGKRLRFVPAAKGAVSGAGHRASAYLILDGALIGKTNGRARNAGPRARATQSIVMFELVASVKVPKKLDLRAPLADAAAALPQLLAEEWGQ